MAESLSELTNHELARLILRKLWQFQAAGGVSMGRSRRSVLLETALDLLPMPEMDDPDLFDLHDLRGEASLPSRLTTSWDRQFSFPHFQLINNRELASLLGFHLQLWYTSDAKKNPQQSLNFEREILNLAVHLLLPPIHHFNESDLIEEAKERHRNYLKNKIDEYDPTFWAPSY